MEPERVEVLFLAEAPSRGFEQTNPAQSRYFYNPDEKPAGTLSWNVLGYLGMQGASKRARLDELRRPSYFLSDTIKVISPLAQFYR
jgi:hypothetical protein